MVYITQLVYVIPGQEKIFDQFEEMAIPLISKYNGKLLFRIRPAEAAFIASEGERPYEVHLVEFASEGDFERFKLDEDRKRFLHLKEQSIRASVMIQGIRK